MLEHNNMTDDQRTDSYAVWLAKRKLNDEAQKAAKGPLDIQIGGDHYKSLVIQPLEYCLANNLPFVEGCVVKYITRWRLKGGVQDLEKIKHLIDVLIAEEKKE